MYGKRHDVHNNVAYIMTKSKFMVHRALYVKTYLSLGLLSPLINSIKHEHSCKILYVNNKYSRTEGKCTEQYAVFHLGLHCLPNYPFRVFHYTTGYFINTMGEKEFI